jgi:hypothetical protein
MDLIQTTTVPPRPLDSREAATLLMGKQHLAFMGCAQVTEHRDFMRDLTEVLPGEVAVFTVTAEYRFVVDHPPKSFLAAPKPGAGPAYFLAFAPISETAVIATTAVMVVNGGGSMIPAFIKKVRSPNPPVFLFPEPGESTASPKLTEAYAVIAKVLQDLHEGRAIDTTSN